MPLLEIVSNLWQVIDGRPSYKTRGLSIVSYNCKKYLNLPVQSCVKSVWGELGSVEQYTLLVFCLFSRANTPHKRDVLANLPFIHFSYFSKENKASNITCLKSVDVAFLLWFGSLFQSVGPNWEGYIGKSGVMFPAKQSATSPNTAHFIGVVTGTGHWLNICISTYA